ncbi:MAG TPA: glycosyltransferase [Azospirillaceae bacterium]|nr:glycosyltransferase [Azospirillaceae bacterium]
MSLPFWSRRRRSPTPRPGPAAVPATADSLLCGDAFALPRRLPTLLEFQAPARAAFRQARKAAGPGGPAGGLAIVQIHEFEQLRAYFGERWNRAAERTVARQLLEVLEPDALPGEQVGWEAAAGRLVLMAPGASVRRFRRRLRLLSRRIASHPFNIGCECFHFTPVIGFDSFGDARLFTSLLRRARTAAQYAAGHLDLLPVKYLPGMDKASSKEAGRLRLSWRKVRERLRLPFQILMTLVVGLVLPFLGYAVFDALGMDITWPMYITVVVMLVATATMIWIEGFLALRATDPPAEPGAPYPPVSAIIAAYMPNEAETIMETVEAFLRQDYPGPMQIIVAYNTPRPMPIEAELRRLAHRDPRLVPFKVEGSTSKAQNVNAAISLVRGSFVGVFDADHQPDPGSFMRAWRWLSNGYDIVQGHCLIRNGDESWVARMVAIEFEQIYCVSHPGRARLHGFGVFGGSNGYWRTGVLRMTRMHHFMLTEDIDSSLRAVGAGYRIASDRNLISRELAPTRLKQLWNQRLRWAQGWFQVSLKWFLPMMVSRKLTLRQKLGMFLLLPWREAFSWISIQVAPIMAYWIWVYGIENVNWFIPIFVATTIYTITTGPGQLLFAAFLADPSIRDRRGWLLWYLPVSFFYTAFKNVISRVAHVKEAMRERVWRVTPRTASAAAPLAAAVEADPSRLEAASLAPALNPGVPAEPERLPGPPPVATVAAAVRREGYVPDETQREAAAQDRQLGRQSEGAAD